MTIPSTKILDHIIHLTPPGTIEQTAQQFKDLGFNVIAGGTHTDGLIANRLVILSDGSYLELASFTHPASHYPISSPEYEQRDAFYWSHKVPGWIDISFLGTVTTPAKQVINACAERQNTGVRYSEVAHGRECPDGRKLEWFISFTDNEHLRGTAPFFCADVTPRAWRVQLDPPSNTVHPSRVQAVAHVRLLAERDALASVAAQLGSVIGEPPRADGAGVEYTWTLEVPSGASSVPKPRFVLTAPTNETERTHLATKGPGIFEVGFWVGHEGVEKEAMTPHGKIVWLKSA